MKLSINLGYVLHRRDGEKRSLEEALKLCRDAGFRHLDYLTPVGVEDFEDQAHKAKELLDSQFYTVSEICLLSGYNNESYFSREFKKHLGISPSEYAKASRQ